MEIIRNCSHYSSIQVAVKLDQKAIPVRIVKSAFNQDGANAIRNEQEGILWYEKQLNSVSTAIVSLENYKNTYARLELEYKNGRPGELIIPLSRNYKKIYNALKYYFSIFNAGKSRFIHGDYSIDNVLFDGDDVVWILDWESFNDKLPREFDIVYCITEAIYFCYRKYGTLKKGDVNAAIELFKFGLGGLKIPYEQIIRGPASYMRKLFQDNKDVFGPQIKKYPIVNCTEKNILAIDKIFVKNRAL